MLIRSYLLTQFFMLIIYFSGLNYLYIRNIHWVQFNSIVLVFSLFFIFETAFGLLVASVVHCCEPHPCWTKKNNCKVKSQGRLAMVYAGHYMALPLVWHMRYLCYVQAVALFKSYFGGAFDEDAIRNNFVLIYELLDGMLIYI